MQFDISKTQFILACICLIWSGSLITLIAITLGIIKIFKKNGTIRFVPKRSESPPISYQEYNLQIDRIKTRYPLLSIVKFSSQENALLIGYTNIPTADSTPDQRKSYPVSAIILNYSPHNDSYYLSLSPLIELNTEMVKRGDKELITNLFCGLSKRSSNPIERFTRQMDAVRLTQGLDFTKVKSWVGEGERHNYFRSDYVGSLMSLFLAYEPGRILPTGDLTTRNISGSEWIHHSSHQYYRIIGCIESTLFPDVIYIVYANRDNGKVYSRRASDWLRSMTLVTDSDASEEVSNGYLKIQNIFESLKT